MPTPAALDAYNGSYFASAHGGAATEKVAVAFHAAINAIRARHVERYADANDIRVDRVLEVGPGGGYFARYWLRQHPQVQYAAVESDTSCHAGLAALGVQLITAADLSAMPTDLVAMSHVLEHQADPAAFIETMTAGLRRGGALFIEVPCRDWEHKPLDEPHLLFFDKPSMHRLLERLGFSRISLSYHGERIAVLRHPGRIHLIANRLRNALIRRGVVAPFARGGAGLEAVTDPLGRAAVKSLSGHREQSEPAWWLRAMAMRP